MTTVQTLILEDDPLMQALLDSVIRGLDPTIRVHTAEHVDAGMQIWKQNKIGMILCDWQLPGSESGVDLVKRIRVENTQVPIIMISGHRERETVVACLRLGANDFIVKPFDPEQVALRLRKYLAINLHADQDDASNHNQHDLIDWLDDIKSILPQLALTKHNETLVSAMSQTHLPSVRELAKLWVTDLAITTKLIGVANNNHLRRYGKPVTTLLEAIGALGVEMSAAQAVALALVDSHRIQDKTLQNLSQKFSKESTKLAETAATIAKQAQTDPAAAYTAGLMYRLGEQAIIDAIQLYSNNHGDVDQSKVHEAIYKYAASYSGQLKIYWHLPLSLRERIGAAHSLPPDCVRKDLLAMRVAAYRCAGELDSPQYRRLCNQLNLAADKK